MKFTIITACLNAGPKVLMTLASAMDQTFDDFEIIVKDGGSTDGTLAGLPVDHRVTLVVSPDSGIYDAMNQALNMAQGEYVVFLNAGDVFSNRDTLLKVSQATEKSKAQLLYTNYTTKQKPGRMHAQPPRLTSFTLFRNTLNHQTCYLHRSCYQGCGHFDSTFRICGDYEFLLRVWNHKPFRAIHLPFLGVTYEGGGISTQAEYAALRRLEFERARRRHFTPAQRTLYSLLWAGTMPRLRLYLESAQSPAVQRSYLWLRNMYYAARSSRPDPYL